MAEVDILLKEIEKSSTVSNNNNENDNLSFGINHSISQHSLSTQQTIDRNSRNISNIRVNSSYIPRKTLSRYGNAFSSMLPYRRMNSSQVEIPIDSIGCLTNTTFGWTTKYRIDSKSFNERSKGTYHNANINEKFLLPKTTYPDSCEVNGKRLIGIYKYEVQSHGQIGSSMLNVAWKFCRTRILVSSLVHSLSIMISLLAPVLFLKLSLDSIHNETNNISISKALQNNKTVLTTNTTLTLSKLTSEISAAKWNRFILSIGIFLSFFFGIFLKSVCTWINLRTASRLRTACISTIFKKAMKSSIIYPIGCHQILSICNEESDALYSLAEHGSLILGTFFGVIACLVSALILLGTPGMWPFFGIIGLFLILIGLAKISSFSFHKSILYGAKKLTVLEDFCINFQNTIVLNYKNKINKKFLNFLSKQYSYSVWYDIFSNKYSGNITSAILLGALYLIWCDVNIKTDTIEVLILIVLYSFYIVNLILDFCDGFDGLFKGKAVLEKLKNTFSITDAAPTKTRPLNNTLLVSITDATFEWNQPHAIYSLKKNNKMGQMIGRQIFTLSIQEFNVPRGHFIGVTGSPGSGKSTLLYSILGHTNLLSGNFKQKGNFAYFPDTPFVTDKSLKSNIIMEAEFDPKDYYNAITIVKLNEDVCVAPGSDELPIGMLELDSSQIERIVFARALYAKRELILLDNPLRKTMRRMDPDFITDIIMNLKNSNKTIIMTTQDEQLLSLCDKVYFLENGSIFREGDHSYLKTIPAYIKMLEDHIYHELSIGQTHENTSYSVIARNKEKTKNKRRSYNRNSNIAAITSFYDNSEENLIEEINKKNNCLEFLTIFDYSFLVILYIINNIGFFVFPFGFVEIVKREYIEPWLAMISMGGIIVCIFIELIVKVYLATRAKRKCELHQMKMFKSLMRTSLGLIQEINIYEIVYYFSVNLYSAFRPHALIVYKIITICISITLIGLSNFWLLFVPFFVLIGSGLIFQYNYYTVKHLYSHEMDTRKNMYTTIRKNMYGRAVIQSFDKINEFSKEFYNLIQDNSTSILMRKSVIYHASFCLNAVMAIGLWIICILVIFVPISHLSISRYVVSIFAYLVFSHNLNEIFLKGFYEVNLSNELLKTIDNFNNKLTQNEIIKLNHEEIINDINQKGLSIKFVNVKCSMTGYSSLEIKDLTIEGGDKVAVLGKGTDLIIPLLSKIMNLGQGDILIENKNILALKEEVIESFVEFIPFNPSIYEATIRSIIISKGSRTDAEIKTSLNILDLWNTVQTFSNKLDEPIANIPRKIRQLICIAKCLLTKPSIIVIEKPDPDIQEILDKCIDGYFTTTTIIFIIGHNLEQFRFSKKIINLDENTIT